RPRPAHGRERHGDRGRRDARGLPLLVLHELPRVRDMERGSPCQGETAANVGELHSVVPGHEVERLLVEDRGLVLRPAVLRLLGRADEVADRTLGIARVPPVAGPPPPAPPPPPPPSP